MNVTKILSVLLVQNHQYLKEVDDKILKTMVIPKYEVIPKIKEKNSINIYINDKIRKLQK